MAEQDGNKTKIIKSFDYMKINKLTKKVMVPRVVIIMPLIMIITYISVGSI